MQGEEQPITGSIYAYPGTGGYSTTQELDTISRLPELQINIFDTTGSVQFAFPVATLNAKLGIVKRARSSQGGFLLDTIDSCGNIYDTSTNTLAVDSVTISAQEFLANVPSQNSIISVGRFQSAYTDFANYVASYFNLSSTMQNPITGFATLFSNVYEFYPNNGVFDASALYHLLHDPSMNMTTTNTPLAGSISISNITKYLRYAVDANPFGNRDPINGSNAIDPSNAANYGVTDGFLSGDVIFVPNNGFAVQFNLNINYASTINAYMQNNNPNVPLQINMDLSNADALTSFHSSTTSTKNYIGQRISAPLLLRLVDTETVIATTSPTADIISGTDRFNVLSYSNISIGSTIIISANDPTITETRTVVGFGSLILDRPLQNNHPSETCQIHVRRPKRLLHSLKVTGITSTSATFHFRGAHGSVSIYRDGNLLFPNWSGTSYTDHSLSGGRSYEYSFVPHEHKCSSTECTACVYTLMTPLAIDAIYPVVDMSTPSPSPTQYLCIEGQYTYVTIANQQSVLSFTNTTSTNTDTSNAQTYDITSLVNAAADQTTTLLTITPYNNRDVSGDSMTFEVLPSSSITPTTTAVIMTKPTITSNSPRNVCISLSTAVDQSVVVWNIYRNDIPIATNIDSQNMIFEDTSVLPNTRYVYTIQPWDTQTNQCIGSNVTKLAIKTPKEYKLGSYVFEYTGDVQTITVPTNATNITFQCWGAGGGAQGSGRAVPASAGGGNGGGGGYTAVVISAIPYRNKTFDILVGEGGQYNDYSSYLPGTFGGGGGQGNADPSNNENNQHAYLFSAASGGGRSAVQYDNQDVITAGGGGGGGHVMDETILPELLRQKGTTPNGGAGGGLVGGDATWPNHGDNDGIGGEGGNQIAGGCAGSWMGTMHTLPMATEGTKYQGGTGSFFGAGGGGGYYGGGGGEIWWMGAMGGGGGGSSYVQPSITNTTTDTIMLQANGRIAPKQSLLGRRYQGRIGNGAKASQDGKTGECGNHGLVLVTFT